jgi:predicted ATPase/DNA-binding SARP family transcriptional activator
MTRFGLLGPAAVWHDGRELDLGGPQQRTVFALLLLHRGAVVATDRIVDVLWPAAPPANAVQVVRTYVSRLRAGVVRTAGVSLVTVPRHGYALRTGPADVDADRLEALLVAARGELDAGAAEEAETLLAEALGLVRGPALPELADDQDARAERERLEELCSAAGEELAEARLAQGRHRELIPALRAAVIASPLRERTWAQLMIALYRSGRQADALAAYRDARGALLDRLGLEPGPQLRDLERMILRHDASLAADAARRRGLPRFRTSFLGRAGELAAVTASLRTARLVTVAGPAGAGKTRLAAEIASRCGPRRVLWAELDAVGPGRVAATVARTLGVRELPGRSAVALVAARLSEAPALLVLDNCEHVIEDAARFVARLLDDVPHARVLATSREPLHVDGERVHRLGGLGTPEPATRLFLERAGSERPRAEDAAAVAEVVSRLDGLPLAIELAAGRLSALSVADLARSLADRLSVLGEGRRVTPPRQRTLETAIAWSYGLVPATEQCILRRLSVFPASFDAAAAEAVAAGGEVEPEAVLPALARLVDASLLAADRRRGGTRYRLLFTVRAFARQRLRASGELESAARRHRDAYLSLAQDLAPNMFGPGLPAGLERARAEHENLHAALDWSLERGDRVPAFRLAASLSMYWFRIGLIRDGRRLVDQTLRHAAADDPWRATALLGRLVLSQSAGAPEMIEHGDAAVAACERGDDAELLALALVWRARTLLDRGRPASASADLDRAEVVAASAGSEEALGFADQIRACAALEAGDLDAAATLALRARDRFRRLRGRLDAGYALIDLARIRLAQRRAGDAHEAAGAALTDFRYRDDPRGIAQALLCLAGAHALLGETERERATLSEAVALATRWGLEAEAAHAQAALDASRNLDEAREEPALGPGVEALGEQRTVAVVQMLGEDGDDHGRVAEELR